MAQWEVIFDGIAIGNFAKVLDVRRDIMAPRTIQTIEVPTRDGAYVMGRKVSPRIVEVDIMFIDHATAKASALGELLDRDVAVPIEFSDKVGVEYYGILSGSTNLQHLSHTSTTTLQFLIADPYGYGEEEIETIPATNVEGAKTINNIGEATTYPEIRATFNQPSTFFAFAADDKFLQLGYSETVTEPAVEREELIFSNGATSTTGWTPLSGSLEDTQALNGAITSNGNAFFLSDPGEGSQWHGGALARALPTPVQDFVFQVKLQHKSLSPRASAKMGKIDVYFRNASGTNIAKITLKEANLTGIQNHAQAGIGLYGYRTLAIDSQNPRINTFSGTARIRREGNRFTAQFAQIVDGKPVWSTSESIIDSKSQFTQPVASIVIMMSAYSDRPVSEMFIDDMHLWRVNPVSPSNPGTPTIFHAGDELRIDMATGRITLNENDFIQHVVPGSQFFGLPPGNVEVGVLPRQAADVEIRYPTRWR